MGDTRGTDSLERGIETAKAGNKLLARLHLLQAVELAPRDPNCWLWLAWVAESPASAMHSLERVLDEDPRHELALLGMRWAKAMAEFELHAVSSVSEEPKASFAKQEESTPELAEPVANEAESHFVGEAEESSAFEEHGAEVTEHDHCEKNECEHNEDGNREWNETQAEPESAQVTEAQAEENSFPEGAVATRRDDMETWVVLESEEPRSEPAEKSLDWFEEDEVVLEARPAEESGSQFHELAESPANDGASSDSDSQPGASTELKAEDRPDESNASDETVEAPGWWQESKRNFAEAAEPSREEQKLETAEPVVNTATESEPVALESPAEELTPAAEEVSLREDEQNSESGVSVLVVDDSPTVRKLVTMTLEKNGFTVASAADGVLALKSIAELKPRLILLDITMPRLGGYQLCKLIKKHESTKHIPVIMLSGKDGMFDKVRGKFVGCDDYITKPFDPDVLVEKVSTQLTAHYAIAGTRS